jgi:hypothetical protein
MTHSHESEAVFPQNEPQDIPSHVSSLTRRDIEDFVNDVTGRDDWILTDWQWRSLGAVGKMNEREGLAQEWRASAASYRPVYVPKGVEPESVLFPTLLSARGAVYAAADFPYGHCVTANDGTEHVVQERNGRHIWVAKAQG